MLAEGWRAFPACESLRCRVARDCDRNREGRATAGRSNAEVQSPDNDLSRGALVALLLTAIAGGLLWIEANHLPFATTYVVKVPASTVYGVPVDGHLILSDEERTAGSALLKQLDVPVGDDLDHVTQLASALNERWQKADTPANCTTDASVMAALAEGRGDDLKCGCMAYALSRLCRIEGIPARNVQLQRTASSVTDAHVVTEVYVDGRWVLVDSTFDLHYQIGGEPLTAVEVRDWTLSNPATRPELKLVRGTSEVAPALDEYYVNPYALFNVVTFRKPAEDGPWDGIGARIPFVRKWARPRYIVPFVDGVLPFEASNLVAVVLDVWTTFVMVAGALLAGATIQAIRLRQRAGTQRS